MYKKNIKQLTAAVLCAAMVMGQAPTVYAAGNEDELVLIEDSGEFDLSDGTESNEDASNTASEEDIDVEYSDDASDELSNEATKEPSEEASDDIILDSAEESSTESDLIRAADDAAETDLPEGVVGMPSDYELTAQEQEVKAELSQNREVFEEFTQLTEGVDYVPNEVICVTESREHAEEIAAAYSGELTSYEYGVAVINLANSEVDITTAYSLAFDKDLNLPAVEPNFVYNLVEPIEEDEDADTTEASADDASLEDESDDLADFEATAAWKDIYNKSVNGISFNDPFLNPSSPYYQWHHDMVKTYDAWKITTGGNYKVTVAVIDTGVQTNHPEFGSRASARPGDSSDGNGHGTHVAGIIAASAGNGAGGAGIAPKANILSVQVLGADGKSTSSDATLKGIRYVAGINANGSDTGVRRADIANLSLGGPGYSTDMQLAIKLATARGVSVIAAMGNEYSNNKSYPAAYKNVIAVGAVDESGSRAYFSCYGSWKDISAPGTDIFSSYPTGKNQRSTTINGYEKMDGTSQATPVVAGACALYMSYAGHVSPESMEAALKRTSTNGIVNVANLIKSAKPAVLTYNKNVTNVQIQTSANDAGYKLVKKNNALSSATLYVGGSLTTLSLSAKQTVKSGSAPVPTWTSSNNDVATVTGNGNSATVKAISKGTAKITCTANDGSGKKATVTIKVAQLVTSVKLTGQTTNVLPGSKISYKAVVYPANANVKTVKYSLDKKYAHININEKTGQVTLDSKATGSFAVIATSTESGVKSSPATVKIGRKTKATSVSIKTPSTTTIATAAKGSLTTSVSLTAIANNGTDIIWKSSNEKVAKLSTNMGTTVTLSAVKAGKVTVTATANDGSKKKASITIKVINPVASLHIVVKGGNSDFAVATGSSANLKAVLGSTYGTPSNKKVEWTYDIYGRNSSGYVKLSTNAQTYCKNSKAFFTLSKSGKLTANDLSTYRRHLQAVKSYGANYSEYVVKVIAKATDGSGSSDELIFRPVPKNSSLRFTADGERYSNYFVSKKGYEAFVLVDGYYYELGVESSNPDIASAFVKTITDKNGNSYTGVYIVCNNYGTANIKVKTLDSSGVSSSFKIEVR